MAGRGPVPIYGTRARVALSDAEIEAIDRQVAGRHDDPAPAANL